MTATTTTVLQPLYRSACISQHLQLITAEFCWCKVLLPVVLMPLLTAVIAFVLWKRCWSSQRCYLHCLRSFHHYLITDL